jgi:hypothetical protein
MGRSQNSRDEALSIALRPHGIDRSVRQLERARQAGLLATRSRRGLGQGPGSEARELDDELDRAVSAFTLLKRHRTYAAAVLAMFVEARFDIAKDKLEKAYAENVASQLKALRLAVATSALVAAAAEWAAGRAAKASAFAALRKRLKTQNRQFRAEGGRFISVSEDLETLLENGFTILTSGQAVSSAGLSELLDGSGVTITNLTGGAILDEAPLDAVADGLAQARGDAIVELVRGTAMPGLLDARDATVLFRAYIRAYSSKHERLLGEPPGMPWAHVRSISDVALAWSIPAFVWFRAHWPDKLDELIAGCEAFVDNR